MEVTYLTWTEDNLLRQVSYQGQREDKPARQSCGRCRTHRGPRFDLGTVDYFVQATEPNSPMGVVAGAGSPRFRRACPDRQSLDGFTAG